MNQQLLKDSMIWGFTLWLIGYILGFVFFAIIPKNLIGWAIMPLGLIITLLVLFKKIKSSTLSYYLLLSVIWTTIAVVFDYLFIIKLLKPIDGYYKLDVYLYYTLTFLVPLIVGWYRQRASKH